ncbi:hypothetical protein [Brenneria tiliae]|uniref:Uncharacterized protein n=1 Tax=Brenneria tiliae TaxID=2914984 RepID=A0ABT0MN13_9GAMM|nr:hypothetical protein [Brenneria tiliae]MCL2891224.1 hypothetical protein [Brenneria tiliae]
MMSLLAGEHALNKAKFVPISDNRPNTRNNRHGCQKNAFRQGDNPCFGAVDRVDILSVSHPPFAGLGVSLGELLSPVWIRVQIWIKSKR